MVCLPHLVPWPWHLRPSSELQLNKDIASLPLLIRWWSWHRHKLLQAWSMIAHSLIHNHTLLFRIRSLKKAESTKRGYAAHATSWDLLRLRIVAFVTTVCVALIIIANYWIIASVEGISDPSFSSWYSQLSGQPLWSWRLLSWRS